MTQACAAVLVVVMFAATAMADLVPGVISSDVTWTRSGNPWTVTQNVKVKNNATLRVEAGAVVEFMGNFLLENDSTTGGRIVVQGAPYDSVYFRPATGVTQWQGLRISVTPGSSFDYCVVLDAKTGLELNTVNTPITYCAFRRGQTGIKCVKSSPAITSCWVSQTSLAGILCDRSGGPLIAQPVILDCNLFDNSGYSVYLLGYESSSVTIMAEGNWWGTNDEDEIKESIYDGYDTGGMSFVEYDPWLAQTPVEHRTWGAIKALFRD